MTDIFISYAREDEKRVREIVRALEEKSWSIFWDRRIPAGKTWQSYIGQALSDARCVIAAWSHHAITSEWVIEEANDAKERGVLVPVLLESVKPPLGFRGLQAADLTEWKPGYSSAHFDQLIQDIAGVLGVKPPDESPLPKPAPPEPQPQEPEPIKLRPPKLGKRRPNFLIGAGIALALAIVVGSALWFTLRLPRPPETRPIEPQVTQAPDVRPEPQEVSKPAVKPSEPEVIIIPAEASPTKQTFTNSIGMSFVLIPAGNFTMGSPTGERGRETTERKHSVTISKAFYLQTTEVTQRQWAQVMGSNPSHFKDCGDDCPVEQVSWDDAQEFIRKLNQKESGKGYRLPTEAEWEYACRAGTSTPFYMGRCVSTNQVNYNGDYPPGGCPKGENRKRTLSVASFPANPWGLYDMHGNVWEWCQDWYGDYPTAQVTDPTGPPTGDTRVLRGGSWYGGARSLRSAGRFRLRPVNRYINTGFRVARDS